MYTPPFWIGSMHAKRRRDEGEASGEVGRSGSHSGFSEHAHGTTAAPSLEDSFTRGPLPPP